MFYSQNLRIFAPSQGGLAQLARALAWHARGHRFEPDILHGNRKAALKGTAFYVVKWLFQIVRPIFRNVQSFHGHCC